MLILLKSALKKYYPLIAFAIMISGSTFWVTRLYYQNQIKDINLVHSNMILLQTQSSKLLLEKEIKETNRLQQELTVFNKEIIAQKDAYEQETDRLNNLLSSGNLRVSILTSENADLRRQSKGKDTGTGKMGTTEIPITGSVQKDILDLGNSINDDNSKIEYWKQYSRSLWELHYKEKPNW